MSNTNVYTLEFNLLDMMQEEFQEEIQDAVADYMLPTDATTVVDIGGLFDTFCEEIRDDVIDKIETYLTRRFLEVEQEVYDDVSEFFNFDQLWNDFCTYPEAVVDRLRNANTRYVTTGAGVITVESDALLAYFRKHMPHGSEAQQHFDALV